MEKFIEVYDDIIPPKMADYIENKVLGGKDFPLYYIRNVSNRESTKYLPGFSNLFITTRNEVDLFNNVLYQLGSYKNFFVKYIFSSRLFLYLPSPNNERDEIHIDQPEPHWVCLYYVNDTDGDTIFFDDDENEIKRVTPKKGRIAFFNGSIKHCSSRPSKSSRAILNFDFLGEKL